MRRKLILQPRPSRDSSAAKSPRQTLLSDARARHLGLTARHAMMDGRSRKLDMM